MKNRNLNLVDRVLEPTPKWFRIVRNLGLALSAVGGVLVASPVALPAAVVSVGGYLLLGGYIIGAVSQTAISHRKNMATETGNPGKTPRNINLVNQGNSLNQALIFNEIHSGRFKRPALLFAFVRLHRFL
ncbi:hypothetical protein LDL59_04235 [Kaistella anthropi]|nr:hypothetical protein [Kaistella anthropi]